MVRSGEAQKDVLVAEAARLAAAADAVGTAVEPFVRAFYEHVPSADVVSRAASDLSDAALSIWRLAAERQAGPRSASFRPLRGRHGSASAASSRSSTTTCRSSSTAPAPP